MPNPNHVIINEQEFIKLSNEIHNYEFIYDKVNYINKATKVIITCRKHGDFEQTPKKHLMGQKCARCRGIKKYNNEEFISKASEIHNNNYSYEKVNYVGNKSDIIIICPLHGEFKQKAAGHLLGYGCMKCCGKERLTIGKFIKRANIIHNNKYNYNFVEYKNLNSFISIICDKHGIFEQRAGSHLSGCGCPICNESRGERTISAFLDKMFIKYFREYKFKDCIYEKNLRFDFYLPDFNCCIEFNGRQHYEEVASFGGKNEFDKTKKRDSIKSNFCKLKNINLLVIKYNDLHEIHNILKDKIKELKTHH